MWLMNGAATLSIVGLIGADPNWRVSQIADLNDDGKSDRIWRNVDGSITAWLMDGTIASVTAGFTGPGALWLVP